jgi:acyl-coenzyme A synthetase/AMP-(fatty) acid ligase
VARAAGLWRQRGLHTGDRVAVKLPDGIDWVVAFLGAIWAGGVAVAVNPQIPAPEWQFILEQAGFNVILAETDADTPEPWKSRVVLVDEGRRAVAAAQPIAPMRLDPETPAFWCHSSGTSGRPKAVVHAHRFAKDVHRVSVERLGLVPEDRLFASSRLFFAYPQTNIFFAGLKLGATLLLDPQWPTAASVVATAQQMKATVLFSVPSLYRVLLADGHAQQLAAAGVRRCISAGEALPAALRQGWADASGIQIIDGYGASEVLVLVLTSVAGDDGLKPSPGVTVRPVDPEAAREGLPSRLCIEVSTLALGYLDQPAAQADSFRNGTFCPADLFVATPGGGWRFAGREDALVKIKGRWVNLVELEQCLSQDVPGLAEAACACVPDADGLDIVAVFYAPQPGRGDEVARALRERCETLAVLPASQALPGHRHPATHRHRQAGAASAGRHGPARALTFAAALHHA